MRQTGIVIKSLDYEETSKIVYLYTSQGHKSVLVRGAKRLKSHNISFASSGNFVSYDTTNAKLPILTDYTVLNSFLDIKEDLVKSLYFSHILELFYKLPEDINHEKTFDFLINMLEKLKEVDIILISTIIQLKLTFLFGVNPNLNETTGKYFSLEEAMFNNIKTKNSLSEEDSLIFKKLYTFNIKNSFDCFKNIDYLKFFKIVNIYYSFHVDISLKGLHTLYTLKK